MERIEDSAFGDCKIVTVCSRQHLLFPMICLDGFQGE